MTARRLNAWARAVHLHCTQHGVSVTVAEAVAACGQPPVGASAPRRLMEHAKHKGFFDSVKVPCADGRRGHWFVASYTPAGPTPEPLLSELPPQPPPRPRQSPSYFDGVKRASSIFDFAEQCNSETTK